LFKLVEKAFVNLKLDYLVFNFDFTGDEKLLFVENESDNETFKVLNKKRNLFLDYLFLIGIIE
jgi:hypothetical protein